MGNENNPWKKVSEIREAYFVVEEQETTSTRLEGFPGDRDVEEYQHWKEIKRYGPFSQEDAEKLSQERTNKRNQLVKSLKEDVQKHLDSEVYEDLFPLAKIHFKIPSYQCRVIREEKSFKTE